MVCAALNNHCGSEVTSTSVEQHQQELLQSSPKGNQKKLIKSETCPIPPIVINQDEDESISMIELRNKFASHSSIHNNNRKYSDSDLTASEGFSNSIQILSNTKQQQQQEWSPLLHGRSIDLSFSNSKSVAYPIKPTNFTATSPATSPNRQYVSILEKKQNEAKSEEDGQKCLLDTRHSFMALIRIKLFSVKRKCKSKNKKT